MNRLQAALRVGGILTVAIGVMRLPVGFGVSPNRDLSFFSNLADLGAFLQMAIVLIAIGLVALGLSFFVPGEMDE